MAEETFAERLWGEVDEAFEPYEIPNVFTENLKKDLKNAFRIRGKARPGYEPGAVARVGVNLVDAVTNPAEAIKDTFTAFTGEIGRPSIPLAWTEAEDAVWRRTFGAAGFDQIGRPLIPLSLQTSILRWNEGARDRGTRLVRESAGIRKSPGLTLMMAQRLREYYIASGARVPVGLAPDRIIAQAAEYESYIAGCLARGDWAGATELQVGKKPLHPVTGQQIPSWGKVSEPYRDQLRKEFERVSRLGGRRGAPQTAFDLANSPEAQFWRYWRNRRLYFQTFNFLNTWREDGFWGMVRVYAWQEFIKRAFPEEVKWRYYLYPPNIIAKGVEVVAEKVRLTALLTKLTEWRQRLANYWKRKVYDRLKKALGWIKKKIFDKAIKWLLTQANRLLTKLGLKVVMAKIGALIGGAIGTVAPGVGNTVMAVLGAVASFIGGIIVEKIWRPVLEMTAYLFAGACGCLALSVGGLVMFVAMILGSVFAPGAGGPGPGPGPLPTPVLVEVDKKVGTATEPFKDRLELENNSGWQTVFWQITVINTGSEAATVTNFHDDFCEGFLGDEWESSFSLAPYEEKELPLPCEIDYNTDVLNDTTIINLVSGTATVGTTTGTISNTAIVIIGEPEACTVAGVVPYYCQCGEPYSGVECKNYADRTVCSYGCGPTSEAMLINYHCEGSVTDPGEIAQEYGCGAITLGATADILGGGLSTGSFGSGDDVDFFAPLLGQLCADRPVITTISHPEISVGHISLIVGVDMARRKIILNDSYVSCVIDGGGAYAEYDFDEYRDWVNTNTYWFWGGALHPDCSP